MMDANGAKSHPAVRARLEAEQRAFEREDVYILRRANMCASFCYVNNKAGIQHGNNLLVVELRRLRHLSQRQLAEMIDSPRTYVSKIERGRCLPCIGQLDKFAGALKVGVGDFLCTEKEFKIRLLLTDPFISQIAEVGKEMKAYDWMLVLQEAKKLAWPTKARVR